MKPTHKGKGTAEGAKNYRCISLTFYLYKAFTSILSNRLMLQCLPQMSENQHGFLPNRSCEEAITAMMQFIQYKEQPTSAVFVAFEAQPSKRESAKAREDHYREVRTQRQIVATLKSMLRRDDLRPNGLIIDNEYDMST